MPWSIKDVDRFKKGLSDKQKEKWVKIANNTLSACLKEKDKDELDCEVKAIRTANSLVSEKRQSVMSLEDKPNPLIPPEDGDIYMTLTDVPDNIEGYISEEDNDKWQLVFPIGLFNLSFYGEVIVTKTYVSRMKEHWENGVLGERSVFMDTQHDFGEANAWAKDMRVTDNGLEIKWEFTDRGKELITSKRYKYYSAAIGRAVDINNGEPVYPVLIAVSLTNIPAMNTMPAASLQDQRNHNSPTHSDRENIMEGNNMTLQEILDSLKEVFDNGEKPTKEQRAMVAELFGINLEDIETLQIKVENLEERLEVLLDENKSLTSENNTLKKEKLNSRKADVIEKALSEGKILPKNKDKWEKMFEKDPEGVEQLLNEKGKEANLETIGNGSGGDESDVDDEKAYGFFKSMHPEMNDEDARKAYKKYGNRDIPIDEYEEEEEN